MATAVAMLAGSLAWGHTFPAVRTVVVQVEPCEVVVMVGYRAATGEAGQRLVAKVASHPKSQALATLRDVLGTQAMAPLTLAVDGQALVPTSVRTKLGTEGDGGRAMVVVLATYALPEGAQLAISSADPRTTRISWADRASGRVALGEAPAQGRWHAAVASFLLKLLPRGGTACVSSSRSSR